MVFPGPSFFHLIRVENPFHCLEQLRFLFSKSFDTSFQQHHFKAAIFSNSNHLLSNTCQRPLVRFDVPISFCNHSSRLMLLFKVPVWNHLERRNSIYLVTSEPQAVPLIYYSTSVICRSAPFWSSRASSTSTIITPFSSFTSSAWYMIYVWSTSLLVSPHICYSLFSFLSTSSSPSIRFFMWNWSPGLPIKLLHSTVDIS